jgi:hypothetical protein
MSDAYFELTILSRGTREHWDGRGFCGEMCERCYTIVARTLELPAVRLAPDRRLMNWKIGEMWKLLWQR